MATPLRLLILEDNPSDAELVLHALRRAGYDPTFARVETEQDYRGQLATGPGNHSRRFHHAGVRLAARPGDHARVQAGHSLHHRFGHHRRGTGGAGHAARRDRLHHQGSAGTPGPGRRTGPGPLAAQGREAEGRADGRALGGHRRDFGRSPSSPRLWTASSPAGIARPKTSTGTWPRRCSASTSRCFFREAAANPTLRRTLTTS